MFSFPLDIIWAQATLYVFLYRHPFSNAITQLIYKDSFSNILNGKLISESMGKVSIDQYLTTCKSYHIVQALKEG